MPNLTYASIEINSENQDGFVTVLYFDGPISPVAGDEDIKAALQRVRTDPYFCDCPQPVEPDEFLSYLERGTPLSIKAGWHRYECNGSC